MVQAAVDTGGKFVDSNCEAHLIVANISINGMEIPVEFSVLAATDRNQVGRTVTERMSVEKASGKFLNLCLACGVINAQQREAGRTQPIDVPDDAVLAMKGRQLCAKIGMQRKQRKNPATGVWEDDPTDPRSFAHVGFDTFSVSDPKAAAIPKDAQYLALLGQAGTATTAPQQQTATTPAANTPAADFKW